MLASLGQKSPPLPIDMSLVNRKILLPIWMWLACLLPGLCWGQGVLQIGKNHDHVKRLFRAVIVRGNQSAVRVFSDRQKTDVALGAIVSASGHILTVASQLGGVLHCQLPDGRRLPARIVGVCLDYDLALLRIPATELPPTLWSARTVPAVGSLLAAPGRGDEPLAIGVLSTPPLRLATVRDRMGVFVTATDSGPQVVRLIRGSRAAQAGLQIGDIVTHWDGQPVPGCLDLTEALRRSPPEKEIGLRVLRTGQVVELLVHAQPSGPSDEGHAIPSPQVPHRAPLEREPVSESPRNNRAMDLMVLQHDTVLRPNDCGGPMVDLEGRAVGINVARAGRVASYALPAATIICLLDDLARLGHFPTADADDVPADFQPAATPALAELQQLETSIRRIAQKVMPCTVGIRIGELTGSGVIVSPGGYVMTAAHVSRQPDLTVQILLNDGRAVSGTTLGALHDVDAGLIRLDAQGPWPFVKPARTATAKPGQWCVAIGHPHGYRYSRGAVVRWGRILYSRPLSIETDCTLIGGDSGGPLLNLDGRLIGIHVQIRPFLASNIHIPTELFRRNWDRLVQGEMIGQPPGSGD